MTNGARGEFKNSEKIEQYKAYLQDLGNIGSRHETARGFYLSVLSALLAFLALTGDKEALNAISRPLSVVVGLGGMAICSLWFVHTLGFTALYATKFHKLGEIEEDLPFQIYGAEFLALKKDWRYRPLTYVECAVAFVFFLLFVFSVLLILCTHP